MFSLSRLSDESKPQRLQEMMSKQVFLGMMSLQYQAVPGIVDTIRKLNHTCIRFIHFSQVRWRLSLFFRFEVMRLIMVLFVSDKP